MKNIVIQTERGTFGYVQVLFDNDEDDGLTISSKGMTMQTLATKINDGSNIWNTDATGVSRCNTDRTDYWDTDLDSTSDKVKSAVYSITLEDVTTNFAGIGAVCFSRNGKFYEASDQLAEALSVPYEFFFICRKTSIQVRCPILFEGADIVDDGDGAITPVEIDGPETPSEEEEIVELPLPSSEIKFLRAVRWGRFGNFSISKFNNSYSIVADEKEWAGGTWYN